MTTLDDTKTVPNGTVETAPPNAPPEILEALENVAKRRGKGKYCILLVVDENNQLSWSTLDVSSMVTPTN